MQITEISRQRKHLVKVKLSCGKEFYLDSDFAAQSAIRVGQNTDEPTICKWLSESDYVRAKSRALWFLDRADHSEKALYDKLLRADIPSKACAKAIARLKELGLFLVVMASSDTEVSLQRLVFSRLTRSLFWK